MEKQSTAIDPERARQIADALVLRHAGIPAAPSQHPDAATLACAIGAAVFEIEKTLPGVATAQLKEVASSQVHFLETHADLILARAAGNRVLERVCDLRLSDVRFDADVSVRIAPGAKAPGEPGDVCVELAGISVDLLLAGNAGAAERLISHYADQADDFDLYGVIDSYERSTALVRAAERARKGVAMSEATRQETLADVRRLITLAHASLQRSVLPPVLIAFGGRVAAGKSTVARTLADAMAAPRAMADRIRDQQLYGAPGREIHETNWAAAFDPGFHTRVYAELLRRAEWALDSGRAVVLDACFAFARDRAAARGLARRHGVPFRFVECRIDAKVQRERLDERDSISGGGWQTIARTLDSEWEPADEISDDEHIVLDTDRPLAECRAELERRIPTWPTGVRS